MNNERKNEPEKSKKAGQPESHNDTPERIIGEIPHVQSDNEIEQKQGRHQAPRNEPSHKGQGKKPSKK